MATYPRERVTVGLTEDLADTERRAAYIAGGYIYRLVYWPDGRDAARTIGYYKTQRGAVKAMARLTR